MDMELQVVMSRLTWVLGHRLWSLVDTVYASDFKASPQSLCLLRFGSLFPSSSFSSQALEFLMTQGV